MGFGWDNPDRGGRVIQSASRWFLLWILPPRNEYFISIPARTLTRVESQEYPFHVSF